MPSSTVELERQLIVEKEQLRSSLERLGDRASDVVDWRYHVRQSPAGTLGLAVLAGVVVGAMTARPGARRPPAGTAEFGDAAARAGGARAELPEWSRLKAGLVGMLADRAIVVAQDFVDRVVPRARGRSSSRAPADRDNGGVR